MKRWLTFSAAGAGLWLAGTSPRTEAGSQPATPANVSVTVRLLGADGQPTAPQTLPKVVKSDTAWRAQLTPAQYRITRAADTERAFCGPFHDNHRPGVYACVGCGLPLFRADAKFDSGTGWPSFFAALDPAAVVTEEDRSFGMVRVEATCANCGAHLGHVFPDGPGPTGTRFCMNSASLRLDPADDATGGDAAADEG